MRLRIASMLAAAALAGCVADRSGPLPLGSPCGVDDECEPGLVCVYGRCRAECAIDRDCPDGGLCVSAPGEPGARYCTFGDERCDRGEACPPGLVCSSDGLCRQPCDDWEDCGPGRRCEEGACFECPEAVEACNGLDDDCDGEVDEGPAGELCPPGPGVTRTACVDGACDVAACEEGLGDCDGQAGTGCETRLDTVEDCRACGRSCPPVQRCGEAGCSGPLLRDEWLLGGSGDARLLAVAASAEGAILSCGSFDGEVDLGEGPEVPAGGEDGFVLARDLDGAPLWRTLARGAGDSTLLGVAPLAGGGALAAGGFTGELDTGGLAWSTADGGDAFVVEIDGAGLGNYTRVLGPHAERHVAVASSPLGGRLAVWNQETVDGEISVHVGVDDGAGGSWARGYLGEGHVEGGGGAFAPSGHPVLVASFAGAASLGGDLHEAAGGLDVATVLWAPPADAPLWEDVVGGPGDDVGRGLGVGPDGAVCVVGSVEGAVDLGEGVEPGFGGRDAFVRCLSADGAYEWSARLGGAGDDLAHAVAVGEGVVVVVGEVSGPADLGGGVRGSAGGTDGFVAGFGRDGTPLWDHSFGGEGLDVAHAVALAGPALAVVAGRVEGTFDLGGGRREAGGEADGFLLLLTLP